MKYWVKRSLASSRTCLRSKGDGMQVAETRLIQSSHFFQMIGIGALRALRKTHELQMVFQVCHSPPHLKPAKSPAGPS